VIRITGGKGGGAADVASLTSALKLAFEMNAAHLRSSCTAINKTQHCIAVHPARHVRAHAETFVP
jgi:hypothetical protein